MDTSTNIYARTNRKTTAFIILLQPPDKLKHTYKNIPGGSLPWDIHKFVSNSPHRLDIFFLCNLPQLLADIPDDTEHCTAYIHRLFLPDCLVDLLFCKDSSWLTGKVRQGVKFVILCQRNSLAPDKIPVGGSESIHEPGILKNRICLRQCLTSIQSCQDLFLDQTGTFCRAKYQLNHTCFVPPSPPSEMLRISAPFSRFWKSSRHIPQIADTEAPATCLFPAFYCLPFFPFLLYRLLL